ncbi:MAG TPA: hypothetical protein VN948_17870 [Terriglobales bacterium]|nr:hypothetical protein [Terriglobales bacterium]
MQTMRRSPPLKIQKERVADFFTKYIDGWLLGDIRYCAQQEKNLSFTVATLVLNAIDFFASLYEGKDGRGEAFSLFLHKYMPSYVAIDAEIKMYKTFRCGLVHQYFPKYHHGITWNAPAEHLKKVDGRYKLNAQSLATDLEQAIAAYKSGLDRDDSLQVKFALRMQSVVSADDSDGLLFGDGNAGHSATVEVFQDLFSEPPKAR